MRTSTASRYVRDAFEAGVDVLTHVGSAGDAPPYSPETDSRHRQRGAARRRHRGASLVGLSRHDQFPERLQDPQLKKDFPPDIWEEVQRLVHELGTARILRTGPTARSGSANEA